MLFLSSKLQPAVQHLVGVAATIGNQFELWLLAVTCNIPENEATNILNEAVGYAYFIFPC
jgi:hypothetical protein